MSLEDKKRELEEHFTVMEELLLKDCRKALKSFTESEENRGVYAFNLYNYTDDFYFTIALNREEDYIPDENTDTGLFSDKYNPATYRFMDYFEQSESYYTLTTILKDLDYNLFKILEGDTDPPVPKKSQVYKDTKAIKKWIYKRFLATGVTVIKKLKDEIKKLNKSDRFAAFVMGWELDARTQIALVRKHMTKKRFDTVFPEIDQTRNRALKRKSLPPEEQAEIAMEYLKWDGFHTNEQNRGGYTIFSDAINDLADLRPVCDPLIMAEWDKVPEKYRDMVENGTQYSHSINLWLKLVIEGNALFSQEMSDCLVKNLNVLYQLHKKHHDIIGMNTKCMVSCLRYIYEEKEEIPPQVKETLNLFKSQKLNVPYGEGALETIDKEKYAELTSLEIDRTGQQSLPENIAEFPDLRYLSFSHNYAEQMDPALCNLTNLQTLILEKNSFTTLPGEMSELENMVSLYLNSNKLETLGFSFEKMNHIKDLYLHENRLSALPESICTLKKLQTLYCQNNSLESLPENIGNLNRLREACFDNNKLKKLPESMGQLTHLKEIYLHNNQLKTIPDSFRNLKKNTYVCLMDNPIPPRERDRIKSVMPHLSLRFTAG